MVQHNHLSNREQEVVKLLLQGKSNKLIASALGISDRTVEFHLRRIYAKYQVNSRVELILRLGNTPGMSETEKPGLSTVDEKRENTENRDKFSSWMNWAKPFRDTVSIIGKELIMNDQQPTNPAAQWLGALTGVIIAFGGASFGAIGLAVGVILGVMIGWAIAFVATHHKHRIGELIGSLMGVLIAFSGLKFGALGLAIGVVLGVVIGSTVSTILTKRLNKVQR